MVGVFVLSFFFVYLCGMKINLPPFLDIVFRGLIILLLLIVSFKLDKFTFGMMNILNPIGFGLGVSLFLGLNIIIFLICYELYQSILNKHYKK
jgi:hypothetical protein